MTRAGRKAEKEGGLPATATDGKADVENQINIDPTINFEVRSEGHVEVQEEGAVGGSDTESTSDDED